MSRLSDTITYWGNPVADGYGGYDYDCPVEISAKWEDTQEQFINAQGEEVVSRAEVFLDQDVDIGGYLYNGTGQLLQFDPTVVDGALQIQAFSKIADVRGAKYERRAML